MDEKFDNLSPAAEAGIAAPETSKCAHGVEKTALGAENNGSGKPAKKRGRVREWLSRHRPTKRRLIQVYAALLYNCNFKGYATGRIYTGATKKLCVPGLNCYSCPGATGACPLGALQNAFAQSGARTPYYVLGILLLLGVMLGRTICGFLCPVGLGQELLYKIPSPKLKKSKVTRVLSYLKYVILAVFVVILPLMYALRNVPIPAFCKYICPAGTFGGAIGLLAHPDNADMFGMLGGLFTWKFCVLVAVVVACIFIYRAFCRFLCPLGAIYGLFNRISLLGIKLDENKCTNCGKCVSSCKMDVRRVGDHECINCGECIGTCPTKAIRWKGSSIFLKDNELRPVTAEKVDLTRLAPAAEAGGAAVAVSSSAVIPGAGEARTSVPTENAVESVTESAAENAKTGAKKGGIGGKRGLVFRITAVVLAVAVLVGAIIYYNVIDKPAVTYSGNKPGDTCPDFTLPQIGREGEFTLSEHRGNVVVVNFWATWCGPCVAELPGFERVREKYADRVDIVAVHSANITDSPEEYILNAGWDSWGIVFVQDGGEGLSGEVFSLLGGRDSYPVTLVIDPEGVIVINNQGSTSEDYLEAAILLALGEL